LKLTDNITCQLFANEAVLASVPEIQEHYHRHSVAQREVAEKTTCIEERLCRVEENVRHLPLQSRQDEVPLPSFVCKEEFNNVNQMLDSYVVASAHIPAAIQKPGSEENPSEQELNNNSSKHGSKAVCGP